MDRSRHEHARVRDRSTWASYELDPGRVTATDVVQHAEGPTQAAPLQLAPARGWPSSVAQVSESSARTHGLVPFDPAPPGLASVQRRGDAANAQDDAHVHRLANAGFAGGGSTLPHLDAIQRSFGRHDVSGVVAHVGGAAEQAARGMGASAYASGNRVAFASAPDLHLAAHEAAHVVQQRGGVSLKGGVGAAGDAYEQHADAVAERVVRGVSAEALLDTYAGGSASGHGAIQRWATEPAEAVDARRRIQAAIQRAATDEDIAGIIRALEAPSSSEGLVAIELPGQASVSIVDLDLAPLLAEARDRQRVLRGEPAAADVARGAEAVRQAIARAERAEQLDAIRDALVASTFDRAGDAVPVDLAGERGSRTRVWVERSAVDGLRAAVERQREELARRAPAAGPETRETGDRPATEGSAEAAPETAPAEPRANLSEVQAQLNRAQSHYIDGPQSVFNQRLQAVENFANAQRETDREASADVLGIAAQAALTIAGDGIGGVVGALISDLALDIARGVFAEIEHTVASVSRSEVRQAPGADGDARSIARYERMQDHALRQASGRAADHFAEGVARRFASAENGVEQARALADGYREAQQPALEEQSIATHAQWATVLGESETMSEGVGRRATGGDVIGTLALESTAGPPPLRITRADQGGMTDEARNMLRERTGTLGDLASAGNPIVCRLVWHGWRPIVGSSSSTITVSSAGVTGEVGTALPEFVRAHYVPDFDTTAPGAPDVAAAIIWSREFANMPIRDLPGVGGG